ncbi:MAG: LamG domain-containing protein [Flavobacteriales bacterium]
MKNLKSQVILLLLINAFQLFGQGSGDCLEFNPNSSLDLGSEAINNVRSIEMWFKPETDINSSTLPWANPQSLMVRDFNNGDGNSTNEFGLCFDAWNNAGKISFSRRIGSSIHSIFSNNNSWNADQWYHIAAIIHPTFGMQMYINGVKQNDTESSTAPIQPMTNIPSNTTMIGKWGSLNIRYFKGDIDEVKLWTLARSESEVRTYMCKSMQGNEAGLKAYYTFDDVSGNSVADESLNNYSGTLINFSTANVITSGAPIGDKSSYLYTSTYSGQEVEVELGNEIYSISDIQTLSEGVHLYGIENNPNSINGLMDNDSNYVGIFSTKNSINYKLEIALSDSNCSNCISLYTRENNAHEIWNDSPSEVNNCVLNAQISNPNNQNEFIKSLSTSIVNNQILIDSLFLESNQIDADYQWVKCNYEESNFTIIPNETNQTFYPSSQGSYAVIISKNSCIDTTECVDFKTQLDVNEIENNIKLYVNHSELIIDTQNNSLKNNKVLLLLDIMGRKVLEAQLNTSILKINIAHLNRGVYFIQLPLQKETFIKFYIP